MFSQPTILTNKEVKNFKQMTAMKNQTKKNFFSKPHHSVDFFFSFSDIYVRAGVYRILALALLNSVRFFKEKKFFLLG